MTELFYCLSLAIVVVGMLVMSVQQGLANRKTRREFAAARMDMDKRVNEQVVRVDGLVRQYRDLIKKLKGADAIQRELTELSDYVYSTLVERLEEVDMSVLAVLEPDEDEEYIERPTQVLPVISPNGNNGSQNGFAAVAPKPAQTGNQYSRYQELRDQGYTAAEATAMLKGQSNGGKGKRNGK